MGGSALLETSHWYSDPSSSLLGTIVNTDTVSPSRSRAGASSAARGCPSPFLTQVMLGAGLPPKEEQVRLYSCPSTASVPDFTTVGLPGGRRTVKATIWVKSSTPVPSSLILHSNFPLSRS